MPYLDTPPCQFSPCPCSALPCLSSVHFAVTLTSYFRQGERMYHHQVVVEHESGVKEALRVHCSYSSNGTVEHEAHNIVRRSPQDGWPSGFQEPE